MEAACGSQCGLFKMHKSAFVANIRGLPRKESNLSSRWTNNPFVLQSNALSKRLKKKSASSTVAEPYFHHFSLQLSVGRDTKNSHIQKKKCFNKRKTIVFEWQLESITGMGYCTALTDKNTFSPFKITTKVHTKWIGHSKTLMIKQTAYFFSPSVTHQAWRRPESEHPWAHCFLLDNGFKTGIDISHSRKTQREHEQACPYADSVFNCDKNTGRNIIIIAVAFMKGSSNVVYIPTVGPGEVWGNRGMLNYICDTHLSAFNNSFLQLKTCNFYYQPVYSW